MRDADGANLDRVQIVKGWLDASGKTHELVYDLVWSGARKRHPKTGKVPPVGNTVNVKEATYSNAIGAPLLQGYWRDPAFDAGLRAFYYVRVIEIPTPRLTTFDAKVFGVALPSAIGRIYQGCVEGGILSLMAFWFADLRADRTADKARWRVYLAVCALIVVLAAIVGWLAAGRPISSPRPRPHCAGRFQASW